MRVLESIFSAMQFVWLSGQRKPQDAFHLLIFVCGLPTPQTVGAVSMSKQRRQRVGCA